MIDSNATPYEMLWRFARFHRGRHSTLCSRRVGVCALANLAGVTGAYFSPLPASTGFAARAKRSAVIAPETPQVHQRRQTANLRFGLSLRMDIATFRRRGLRGPTLLQSRTDHLAAKAERRPASPTTSKAAWVCASQGQHGRPTRAVDQPAKSLRRQTAHSRKRHPRGGSSGNHAQAHARQSTAATAPVAQQSPRQPWGVRRAIAGFARRSSFRY